MEPTEPTRNAAEPDAPTPRRKIAVGGAILGALALLFGMLAFSTGAGAQDAPALTDVEEADTDEDDVDIDELDSFDANFAAFDSCLQAELGIGFETADEAAFEAIDDEAWEAAETACEDQLPPEILEMEAAWERFDQCLADNGIDVDAEFDEAIDLDDFPPVVFVETPGEFSVAEFGEGDGSIVITQAGGEITMTTDGDVELTTEPFDDFEIDEDWDRAFEACESELPEDAFIDDVFEGDLDEFDGFFDDDSDEDERAELEAA